MSLRSAVAGTSLGTMVALCNPLTVHADSSVEFGEAERQLIISLKGASAAPADTTNGVLGNPFAISLGRALFFEPRLSSNGRISCSTCHDPRRSWADGSVVSSGLQIGKRNAPSLWNVSWNRWFSWDGKASTLWAQAVLPITDPNEMGGSASGAISVVSQDPNLGSLYKGAFGSPIDREPEQNASLARLGKALAAYITTLNSSNSRFDQFASAVERGDADGTIVLTRQEKQGLKLFLGKAGCVTCHHSPNFTDGEFHNLRLPDRGSRFSSDPGRYQGINQALASEFGANGRYSDDPSSARAAIVRATERRPEQWGAFKTPTLRNVAKTAPYMHAGQFATLRDVVMYYSTFKGATPADHHQETTLAPLNLDDAEVEALVSFLLALTDESKLPEHGR